MHEKLYIVDGPDNGRSFELRRDKATTIGRGQASDKLLNDPRISRIHCQIEYRNGEAFLIDAKSMGGTFVEGQKISEHRLRPGDVFKIGDSSIRYALETPDDEIGSAE